MLGTPRLEVQGLSYSIPGRVLLDGIDLSVTAGEAVAVMGPSGSGKSTLLNCLAGITLPSAGEVVVDGAKLTAMPVSARARFRLRWIGVVFQFGELLPELTILENVAIPLRLQGCGAKAAEASAGAMLARLGVVEHAGKHPAAISGGEVQRVGIARALAHEPTVVLADEPTGAVDEDNAAVITELLIAATRELGAAVIIATHDPNVAARADRVFRLRAGRLVEAGEPALQPLAEGAQ